MEKKVIIIIIILNEETKLKKDYELRD